MTHIDLLFSFGGERYATAALFHFMCILQIKRNLHFPGVWNVDYSWQLLTLDIGKLHLSYIRTLAMKVLVNIKMPLKVGLFSVDSYLAASDGYVL